MVYLIPSWSVSSCCLGAGPALSIYLILGVGLGATFSDICGLGANISDNWWVRSGGVLVGCELFCGTARRTVTLDTVTI